MHQLYFVKIKADNPYEAITSAEQFLVDNNFSGEGGMFSSPKADWFLMGGRWSGLLSTLTWASRAYKEIQELEDKHDIRIIGCFYCDKEKTKKQEELKKEAEKIWSKYQKDVPKECKDVPYFRDNFASGFQVDDAMILTKELIEKLKENYGEVEVCCVEDYDEIFVSDLGELDLGDYLVVVDYHT
jgi:hypothetical protein